MRNYNISLSGYDTCSTTFTTLPVICGWPLILLAVYVTSVGLIMNVCSQALPLHPLKQPHTQGPVFNLGLPLKLSQNMRNVVFPFGIGRYMTGYYKSAGY